jgi:4-diphosphocytidyl-2-C-methyl-D-erythritol kinase
VSTIRANACAKINLSLTIRGIRRDGYHELTTTLQTIALHDRLTFTSSNGPFEIRCDEPRCPTDRSNLIWRAADALWRGAGKRGEPAGVRVTVRKRIPLEAGLGGGSSDAAAALRALARLWRVALTPARLGGLAKRIGADVPFFLVGGTARGSGRGDRLRVLDDPPPMWVALVLPSFGVSTKDAYCWWDEQNRGGSRWPRQQSPEPPQPSRQAILKNDLEAAVGGRHPEIGAIVAGLRASGASHAAMSGSGSAVFGLFDRRRDAEAAVKAAAGPSRRAFVSRTLARRDFRAMARPR